MQRAKGQEERTGGVEALLLTRDGERKERKERREKRGQPASRNTNIPSHAARGFPQGASAEARTDRRAASMSDRLRDADYRAQDAEYTGIRVKHRLPTLSKPAKADRETHRYMFVPSSGDLAQNYQAAVLCPSHQPQVHSHYIHTGPSSAP